MNEMNKEFYKFMMHQVTADGERNFWMTSQEAQEYGIVDQILTKK